MNPGVQLIFTALCVGVSNLTAITFVGANGNSITLSLALLVSLPPGDITEQVYCPTSDARTALISKVPSSVILIRVPLIGLINLKTLIS